MGLNLTAVAGSRGTIVISALDSGDWTMGAWVFSRSGGGGNNGRILSVANSAGTTIQELRCNTGGSPANNRFHAMQKLATTDALRGTTPFTSLVASTWQCVVATFTSGTLECDLYLGTPATPMAADSSGTGHTTGVGSRTTGGVNAYIGNNNAADRTFDGVISWPFFVPRLMAIEEIEEYRLGYLAALFAGPTVPRLLAPLDHAAIYDWANGTAGTLAGTYSRGDDPFAFFVGEPVYGLADPADTYAPPSVSFYKGMRLA